MSRPRLTISVAQFAGLIRARAAVVLGIAAVVMATVLAAGYGSELVFVARGQLFLGEVLDAAKEEAADSEDEDGVSGEIEILGSASLVERAALASGLNVSVGSIAARPPRYSDWLAAGQEFGALPLAENELALADASVPGAQRERFIVEFSDETHYRVWPGPPAFAEAAPAPAVPVGAPLAEGVLAEPLESTALSWTLLPGPARRPRAGARYEVAVTPAAVAAIELVDRLRVSAPRASGSPHFGRIVTLEFTASSPFRAQRFLTALLDAYLTHRHERKVGKLVAREVYLEGESRSVEAALDHVEEQLAAVRASQRSLWLGDDDDSPLLVERDRYRAAESRSMLEVARLLVYSQQLAGPAPPLASFMQGESGDAQLQALSAALADAERELTDAEQAFTDDAEEVHEQKARVADRKRAIARYVGTRLERANVRQAELEKLVVASERKLDSAERSKQSLVELTRDREAYAETYTRLLDQKGEASLVIAKAVSKDRIIDPPRAVAEPASPNFREALSSGLFGLFVGAVFVLFRRLTAGTVQAESDARRFLGDVPVLGRVPCHERRHRRRALLSDVIEDAAVSGQSPSEEAFRLLALSLMGTDARREVVFVTSPGPGDGKTSCALGLGLALSRRGRRVIIVDASPVAPLQPGVEAPAPGLEDVLHGTLALRTARLAVDVAPGELHLLSAGSPGDGPSSAEQLSHFLEVARARYEVVLVDVPGHVPTNAMACISATDHILLVVGLGHTRRRLLDELLGNLPHARTLGLVVDPRPRAARKTASAPAPLGREGPLVSV